jgi:hypothetical protein
VGPFLEVDASRSPVTEMSAGFGVSAFVLEVDAELAEFDARRSAGTGLEPALYPPRSAFRDSRHAGGRLRFHERPRFSIRGWASGGG